MALDVLAAAQAEVEDFREAIATAGRALAIPVRPDQTALVARIRERLEMYRQGRKLPRSQ